jgi:preprotein translocase SecE subunit
MNNQKYIVFLLLGTAFLVSISLRGLIIPVLARLEVGDPLVIGGLSATTLAALGLGAALFVLLNRHRKVVSFTDESVSELRAVFWPDKEETLRFTSVVIAVTLFIAVMLGVYDYVWAEVTRIFLFTES